MAAVANLKRDWAVPTGVLAATLVLSVSPVGSLLESTLYSHVLIQIPMLILLGVALGYRYRTRIDRFLSEFNQGGICGVLLASLTIGFWMIPRWLDASLSDQPVALAKYSSLILLAGIPLALSWGRLGFIARGFVKIEFLGMLYRLGWLYLISPLRLCNSYRIEDQIWLGRGMLILAITFSVYWVLLAFFAPRAVPQNQ